MEMEIILLDWMRMRMLECGCENFDVVCDIAAASNDDVDCDCDGVTCCCCCVVDFCADDGRDAVE
jgi:hypothetical protein